MELLLEYLIGHKRNHEKTHKHKYLRRNCSRGPFGNKWTDVNGTISHVNGPPYKVYGSFYKTSVEFPRMTIMLLDWIIIIRLISMSL